MEVGELRVMEAIEIFGHRVFFINKILGDGEFEVVFLDGGERWCFTYHELAFYSKIISADRKCP